MLLNSFVANGRVAPTNVGGSGWESNPPRPATRPATGFEDQEAHRDLTTPAGKDNRDMDDWQVAR